MRRLGCLGSLGNRGLRSEGFRLGFLGSLGCLGCLGLEGPEGFHGGRKLCADGQGACIVGNANCLRQRPQEDLAQGLSLGPLDANVADPDSFSLLGLLGNLCLGILGRLELLGSLPELFVGFLGAFFEGHPLEFELLDGLFGSADCCAALFDLLRSFAVSGPAWLGLVTLGLALLDTIIGTLDILWGGFAFNEHVAGHNTVFNLGGIAGRACVGDGGSR